MTTLLIDGDILAFKTTVANEVSIDWGNDLWTLHCDIGNCKTQFKDTVQGYKELFNADEVILAFSPKRNFRYDVLETYKSNRKGVRKPICYAALKEWAHTCYSTFERPCLEGDDILGILATSPVIVKGEKIVISIDKDLKTIPCKLFDGEFDDKGEPVIKEIDEVTADYNHMIQTLIGDKADGYTGCPSIGIKTAEKLLAEVPHTYEDMWEVVRATYAKKGLSEEYALKQAQVARICRREDYDFKKKEVKLWLPPQMKTELKEG